MALLQIAEPGESASPHEHRLAVGIDLGTTNSLIGYIDQGQPRLIPNAFGEVLTPVCAPALGAKLRTPDDLRRVRGLVDAALVGTSLMKSPDRVAHLRALVAATA